jgi:sugar phosphate isomerase/epimerase
LPLRFGITALEFHEVAERVIIDGVPDFTRLDVVDIIRDTASAGYSIIELSTDVKHVVPGSLTPESIRSLIDLKDEIGHTYTIHLPFWSIELATFNENVRMGGVDSIIEAIELTKPLEPEAYVLHATGELAANFSNIAVGADLARLINVLFAGYTSASIEDIISRTEIAPLKLAIENVIFPFDIMRDVIDDLDTGICFDTAHLLSRMSGTESVMDFYKAHKDRITEIHLQDATYKEYDGAVSREDHIPLGKGIFGDSVLHEFLSELVKDKFGGPIIFELTKDETKESLNHIKKVAPGAFGSYPE